MPDISDFFKTTFGALPSQVAGGVSLIPGVTNGPGGIQWGVVPTEALTALFPYTTYGPNLAERQAEIQFEQAGTMERLRQQLSNQLQIAQAENAGRVQEASIHAGGVTAAASESARGQIESARIAADARIQEINAQFRAQLAIAGVTAGLDRAKAIFDAQALGQRLQAELQNRADLANQEARLRVAELAGSGRLRDTFAAILFQQGLGPQPGLTSAFQGPFVPISTPQIPVPAFPNFQPIDVSANLPRQGPS